MASVITPTHAQHTASCTVPWYISKRVAYSSRGAKGRTLCVFCHRSLPASVGILPSRLHSWSNSRFHLAPEVGYEAQGQVAVMARKPACTVRARINSAPASLVGGSSLVMSVASQGSIPVGEVPVSADDTSLAQLARGSSMIYSKGNCQVSL